MHKLPNGHVKYRFGDLPQDEKDFHEEVLVEEIDRQEWFAIAFSEILDDEIFVTTQ